jgi:hypothetical protein
MRFGTKASFALIAAGLTLSLWGISLRAQALDDVPSLEGAWQIAKAHHQYVSRRPSLAVFTVEAC